MYGEHLNTNACFLLLTYLQGQDDRYLPKRYAGTAFLRIPSQHHLKRLSLPSNCQLVQIPQVLLISGSPANRK